ncbi:MAG: tetratricopeptide repeat protein [Anaerolineales bacterium]|jgi:hypothetical protein
MDTNKPIMDLGDIEISEYYIYINSIGFSGSFSKSKNGKYIIAWKDGFFSYDENLSDESIDIEGKDIFIKIIEKAIVDNGSPEWKERFIKVVKENIFEVRDNDWIDKFFKIVNMELDKRIKMKWKHIFIDALTKNVQESAELTIHKIHEMNQLESEAQIIVAEGEFDNKIEKDWEYWNNGKIVLLEDGKVIFQDELERPDRGKVANNGIFIINDLKTGGGLKSNFLAYTCSGKRIVQHLFSANLHNNGLSYNGQYAVFQLARSDTTDSHTMALFDLESGKLLWQKVPETWIANSFEFDIENNAIYLVYEDSRKFKYSLLNGEFLDEEKWYQDRIQYGTGFDLIKLAEGSLSSTNNSEFESVDNNALSLYILAVERLKDSPFFRAQTYRKIGEIYERLQDFGNAVNNYELALKYNPKVGVKNKLQLLKDKFKPE